MPLGESLGHVLREDLVADRDFPPFDRVTMDGIALVYNSFATGKRDFKVEGIQAAGDPQKALKSESACLEVMTGAILPKGTDTVIRYEDLNLTNETASVVLSSLSKGQNIHRKGHDRKEGDLIVKKGAVISPAEIGVAATIGKNELWVANLPKVAIVSTGDELVDVKETPLPHQIRKSNIYTIQALLQSRGLLSVCFHLDDDKNAIEIALEAAIEKFDVLILSGGVSKGKFDFIPDALEKLGFEKHFHKVSQRPGKPFWFGTHKKGMRVFALPGNPVSSFMCACKYFLPWLNKSLGLDPEGAIFAELAEDFKFMPKLTYFLQVRTSYSQSGKLTAYPEEGHGSGDLANLTLADAFLELPAEKEVFNKGEVYPLIPFRAWPK